RQRPAMGALEQALMMKQLQVLADGDEGGVEAPRKVADEYAAFVLKEFDGLPAAFFVQHGATFFRFPSKTFFLFRCNHSDIRNQTRQDSVSPHSRKLPRLPDSGNFECQRAGPHPATLPDSLPRRRRLPVS